MKQNNPLLTLDRFSIGLPEGKEILQSIELSVNAGDCHIIMGPNGSGKSSLLSTIMGLPPYEVRSGRLQFQGEDITENAVDERASKGIFMSFQAPVSIPGVSNLAFYKAIVQEKRLRMGLGALDTAEFMNQVKGACQEVGLPESFLRRDLNDDFSGGERKRNELLQILLLEPQLVMLDEIDSGLDIDAMRNFAEIIKKRRAHGTTFLIVTHYHRFIETLEVDQVHVLLDGKKVASGQTDIIQEIEANGYSAWT